MKISRALISVGLSLSLTGCGSSDNAPRIPNPETVETIQNFQTGSGDQCIYFDHEYVVKTKDGVDTVKMFELSYNEDFVQEYRMPKSFESEKIEFKDIIKDLKYKDFLDGGVEITIQALIAEQVRINFNKMVDLMLGGVVANGAIQDTAFRFEDPFGLMNPEDMDIPIRYAIDCFYEEKAVTSIHINVMDWYGRLVYTQNADGTVNVSARELIQGDNGPQVSVEDFTMIPMSTYKQELEVEEERELSLLPPAYRDLQDKSIKVVVENSMALRGEKLSVFMAFYNRTTKRYKVLNNVVGLDSDSYNSFVNYFIIPLSFIEAQQGLIESGDWDLVVSSTPQKSEGIIFRDYWYYPLDGDNESLQTRGGTHTVLTNSQMRLCPIAQACEGFKRKTRGKVQIDSTSKDIDLVTTFVKASNPGLTLLKCTKPGSKSSCFKKSGRLN